MRLADSSFLKEKIHCEMTFLSVEACDSLISPEHVKNEV